MDFVSEMCVCHEVNQLACLFMCVYAKYGNLLRLPAFVCRCVWVHVCVCVSVRERERVCVRASSVWAGFRVGVLSSVHQKLKPVRLPYFRMEPPDVIAANPSSCDLTQLDCP